MLASLPLTGGDEVHSSCAVVFSQIHNCGLVMGNLRLKWKGISKVPDITSLKPSGSRITMIPKQPCVGEDQGNLRTKYTVIAQIRSWKISHQAKTQKSG